MALHELTLTELSVELADKRTSSREIVDTLLGEFQTVIKPLSKMFQQVKCISGSTILGSGEVALILDVGAIVQQVVHRESRGVTHASHRALPPADSTLAPAARTTYATEADDRP